MTIVLRLKLYKILLYTARIACENTYEMRARHVNFSNSIMQKYELSRQTLKMTIVLRLKLYNILLYTVRTAYENT